MTVTKTNEIELAGNKYRIKGGVNGRWENPFPQQMTIGDADYDNRLDLSSYIINDLRGGIGVEEMDEKVDQNKCWWTNCIIKYRNHILPPRLAVSVPIPTTITPTLANTDFELDSDWIGGARSDVDKHAGTYSWLINNSAAYQDAPTWAAVWQGRRFTVTCWVKTAVASTGRISIDDGTTTTYSSYHTGGGAWEQLTVTAVMGRTETRLRVNLLCETVNACYFDDCAITAANLITGAKFANFNGELYGAFGAVLGKLNSTRTTGFTALYEFSGNISDIIPSLNSRLYIYMGDSTNYYYMSTADVITQSNSAVANWGIQYDAKLFKMATTGAVAYSTDPDGATPTWTTGSSISDIASQIEGFVIGRNAAGSYTLYVATNSILKAYDSTPLWVDTEARLPNHPIGGKGRAYWNGKLYLSYGLGVKEYYPETGTFIDIGLTERDGLPVEYNGEITKLLGDTGLKGMFASVDASVTPGNSKSGLYLYDGFGWQCWWVDTSNNGAMHDIIVSSAASSYAVYWNVGGACYYIDIPRGIENPDKISQSYATSGIFITPWFDAGNPVASKLAKLLVDYAKGITTTGTVVLKYRLDHIHTDLDAGWTTMDTLDTTAESGYNEELFASGAGSSIKAIQFRLDITYSTIEIDAGSAATDRAQPSGLATYTLIDLANPANADGNINSIEVWAQASMTGLRVGTFYLVSGTTYKCRDSQTIGAVTAGSKQTYSVSISVESGDFIGCYFATGDIEEDPTGGSGIMYVSGEYIDPADQVAYALAAGDAISLYATGASDTVDVQSLVFYYKKRTGSEKLRVWNVNVICDEFGLTSAKQKVANLKSAIESATDVAFSYHPNDASTESYYVTVDCPEFDEQTGRDYEANFALRLIES